MIKSIEKLNCYEIIIDGEIHTYFRYNYNSWHILVGRNFIPVYKCDHLEKMFQQWDGN